MHILLLLINLTVASEENLNIVANERFLGKQDGYHGSFFIKKGNGEVLKSSNGKMIISKEEVIYNGKSANFLDLIKKNPKQNETQGVVLSEFSFLKYYPSDESIEVKIDQMLDGGFVVEYNNEKNIFFVSKDSGYSNVGFQSYFPPGSGQNNVDTVLRQNPDLQVFLRQVEECTSKESVECLKELSSPSLKKTLDEKVNRRIIFDDPLTCKVYNQKNNRNLEESAIPKGLANKANHKNTKLWSHLKEASMLNNSTNYILFHTQNHFTAQVKTLTVIRNILIKNSCDNYNDLELDLEKVNNEWKIMSLFLTNRD
nr:hypothetical protein BHI3_15560 [Bacteriovorax sp. HI3]